MNTVQLIGRLTKDPEIKYQSDTQLAVCRCNVAIDRPPKKDGEKQTDFPPVVVFGKQAENMGKYCEQGSLIGIQGSVQTGRYKNKDGNEVFTTSIVASRVEFLSFKEKKEPEKKEEAPEGFEQLTAYEPF